MAHSSLVAPRLANKRYTTFVAEQPIEQNEHLACPKCGYDLFGIPAVRCPECGFRYDALAVKAMLSNLQWARLGLADEIVACANIGWVIALMEILDHARLAAYLWVFVVTLVAAYLIIFLSWGLSTDFYGTLKPPSFVILVTCWCLVWMRRSSLVEVAGVAIVGYASFLRLVKWRTLPAPYSARTRDLQAFIERRSLYSTAALCLATILLVLSLL